MDSQNPEPHRRPGALVEQLSLALELPFVLVAGVLIGGGIGYLLDRWLHISPALTLVGGLLGFGGGIWEILKRLSRGDRNRGSGDGEG